MPADPTDADQAFALGLIHGLPLSLTGRVGLPEPTVRALTDRIAQALADERERARAPFLDLADELDSPFGEGDYYRGLDRAVDAIRAIAAQEPTP